MRFSLSASLLRDALNRARQVIPAVPSLVAYSGVLLRVGTGRLEVTASDGDSTITLSADVTDAEDGQVLLPPKPVLGFLASVDGSTLLTVEKIESGDLRISGDGFNPYVFRPLSASFPLPATPGAGVTPSGLATLGPALQAVRAAASRDPLVVQVVSDEDQLVLHTTDGFRLARAVLPGAGFGTFTGVLALPVLERVARFGPDEVVLDTKARQISFKGAGVLLTSRMLGTPFPPVESVLNAAPPQVTSFEPAPLVRALSRISAVAEQGAISLELTGSEMHLRASAAEVGEGHEMVPLLAPVPAAFSLQIRAHFLADAVSSLGDGPIGVAYSGTLQPLFLTASSPFSITQVVMPVRS
jgi:DNA polymerase III sliding clamp (beta) subunit (PCNA family)